MNGADLFVQALTDRGVEFVTTVSGNGTEPLYEACPAPTSVWSTFAMSRRRPSRPTLRHA
jgi:thiamine pyrophosphate-dependent acetolactate synthase large subunit-like protein